MRLATDATAFALCRHQKLPIEVFSGLGHAIWAFFLTSAKDVAMHIAAMKPVALSSEAVPAELIEKERSVAQVKAQEDADKAVAEGKQPQSAEIASRGLGKTHNWRSRSATKLRLPLNPASCGC